MRAELRELTEEYYRKLGYSIRRPTERDNIPPEYKVDLIAEDENTLLIIIKDWRRSIGVNVLINADKMFHDIISLDAFRDVNIKIIVVGNMFSQHARSYVRNRRQFIGILSRDDILRFLQPYHYT